MYVRRAGLSGARTHRTEWADGKRATNGSHGEHRGIRHDDRTHGSHRTCTGRSNRSDGEMDRAYRSDRSDRTHRCGWTGRIYRTTGAVRCHGVD